MIGWTAEHMELAGLIAYGTAEIVSAGRTPRAPGKKRSRRDRLAALGQVSRSVPGDLCSLRWVLRKDSLMNGGYPLRPVASARTRPVAGIAAQPGGCQRPRPAPQPTAVARLRPADQLHATAAEVCGRWRRLPPKGAGPALTDSIHYRGCYRGAGCIRPGRRGSSARRRQALTGALRNPATVATAVRGCATVISAVHGFTGPGKPSPEWIDRDASRAPI